MEIGASTKLITHDLILAVIAFFIYTVHVYHRFFHIIPKSGFE